MKKTIVEFKEFSYIYPYSEDKALDNINISIEEGSFVGVVGRNKAGKSTFSQAMTGIIPHLVGGQYEGDVYINGAAVSELGSSKTLESIGIVFQDAESQFTQETVEDEIAFSLCNFGIDKSEMKDRVIDAATSCNMMDMLDRSPFKLSGGQQQRLSIACILALKPQVIILDESTSQLDPIGRDSVFTLVVELHKKGHTIIMIDHNVEKIAEYAEKVLILNEGKVFDYGNTEEVFQRRDELIKVGVRVPQVTEVSLELKNKLGITKAPIKLKEAQKIFEESMKRGEMIG